MTHHEFELFTRPLPKELAILTAYQRQGTCLDPYFYVNGPDDLWCLLQMRAQLSEFARSGWPSTGHKLNRTSITAEFGWKKYGSHVSRIGDALSLRYLLREKNGLWFARCADLDLCQGHSVADTPNAALRHAIRAINRYFNPPDLMEKMYIDSHKASGPYAEDSCPDHTFSLARDMLSPDQVAEIIRRGHQPNECP